MTAKTPSPVSGGTTPRGTPGQRHQRVRQRAAAAQQRAAARHRANLRRRLARWGGLAAAVLLAVAGVAYLVNRGDTGTSAGAALVGGDLHTVAVVGDAVFVGGHDAVAVSHDGGRAFEPVGNLAGADAMGWAADGDTILVGGHPGLYRSTDRGTTFAKVTGGGAVDDVHALGAAAGTVYLASPKLGLLVSTDNGRSWAVRNAQAGRSFMGSLLVDPANPQRLIAPDMATGLVISVDGGRTFAPLGGPAGAMAVAWNPMDVTQIIAVGMNGAARSSDAGATWQPIQPPAGTSAVAYDPAGTTVYAGVLDGQRARLYRSGDGGMTWSPAA